MRKLVADIGGDAAIHRQERGFPIGGQAPLKLADDIRFARLDVRLVVEDRVAEQGNVWHGGCAPSLARVVDAPVALPNTTNARDSVAHRSPASARVTASVAASPEVNL